MNDELGGNTSKDQLCKWANVGRELQEHRSQCLVALNDDIPSNRKPGGGGKGSTRCVEMVNIYDVAYFPGFLDCVNKMPSCMVEQG